MSIESVIAADAEALFAKLTGIDKQILAKIVPLIEGEAGTLLNELVPIAEGVVKSLASGTQPGLEKLTAAIPQIAALAEAAGLKAGTGAIITAVQVVLANLPAAA